jgi:hypothetical protein
MLQGMLSVINCVLFKIRGFHSGDWRMPSSGMLQEPSSPMTAFFNCVTIIYESGSFNNIVYMHWCRRASSFLWHLVLMQICSCYHHYFLFFRYSVWHGLDAVHRSIINSLCPVLFLISLFFSCLFSRLYNAIYTYITLLYFTDSRFNVHISLARGSIDGWAAILQAGWSRVRGLIILLSYLQFI